MAAQEIEILLAAKRFYNDILIVLEEQEQEWLKEAGSKRLGEKVDLASLGENVFLKQFRFTYSEVEKLVDFLQLPDDVRCPDTGVKEDSLTALCMLLRRLAYPARLCDIQMQFGWEGSRFSRITRLVALHIYNRWKHVLRFDSTRLTAQKLESYASHMTAKGCPHPGVCSSMDGTLDEHGRPIFNQRIVFSGWKRMHCSKYHFIVAPDGIVIHVFGPIEGRLHDQTCFRESGVINILEKHFWRTDGETALVVYGDSAYPVSRHVCSPYKGKLTEVQQQFNAIMAKIREPVEWMFKEMGQQFAFLNFPENKKLLLQPIGLYYLVSVLLCNCHTILHGNQVSKYFKCAPPPLGEYLHGDPVPDAELDNWCLQSPIGEVEIRGKGEDD